MLMYCNFHYCGDNNQRSWNVWNCMYEAEIYHEYGHHLLEFLHYVLVYNYWKFSFLSYLFTATSGSTMNPQLWLMLGLTVDSSCCSSHVPTKLSQPEFCSSGWNCLIHRPVFAAGNAQVELTVHLYPSLIELYILQGKYSTQWWCL